MGEKIHMQIARTTTKKNKYLTILYSMMGAIEFSINVKENKKEREGGKGKKKW